jgi:hypothetical protein
VNGERTKRNPYCAIVSPEHEPKLVTSLTASEESAKVVLSALALLARPFRMSVIQVTYLYSAVILPRSAGWASSVMRRGDPRPEKPDPNPTRPSQYSSGNVVKIPTY